MDRELTDDRITIREAVAELAAKADTSGLNYTTSAADSSYEGGSWSEDARSIRLTGEPRPHTIAAGRNPS